jgi:hypothetical protein
MARRLVGECTTNCSVAVDLKFKVVGLKIGFHKTLYDILLSNLAFWTSEEIVYNYADKYLSYFILVISFKSATRVSITTFSTMTLSMKGLNVTLSKSDNQHTRHSA